MKYLEEKIRIDPQKVVPELVTFIKNWTINLERDRIIMGLSGGLDSAVVAKLCAMAVGPENVIALLLPEKDSKQEHLDDAGELAGSLGIKTKLIDITPYLKAMGSYKLFPINNPVIGGKIKDKIVNKAYDYYQNKTGETPFAAGMKGLKDKQYRSYLMKSNAYYRVKHRLRMVLFYLYGEQENRLVVGCANKTELRVGYFVKHGCDAATDIMPIMHLYKTQVRELARFLEIPDRIISKPPSPDIIPGITDEMAIGIPYEKLDLILLGLELDIPDGDIALHVGIDTDTVEKVKILISRSEHMRQVYVPEM